MKTQTATTTFIVLSSFIGTIQMLAADTPAPDPKRAEALVAIRGVCQAMNSFQREYGYFPKGDGATIMQLLTSGTNARRLIFFAAPKKSFNAAGAFLDPWGTPIQVGSFASGVPWAYSCGPNQIDEGGGDYSDDIATW